MGHPAIRNALEAGISIRQLARLTAIRKPSLGESYDKTKEPSETAEKSASERGNASSEAHDGGKVSNFRRETGKYKK